MGTLRRSSHRRTARSAGAVHPLTASVPLTTSDHSDWRSASSREHAAEGMSFRHQEGIRAAGKGTAGFPPFASPPLPDTPVPVLFSEGPSLGTHC